MMVFLPTTAPGPTTSKKSTRIVTLKVAASTLRAAETAPRATATTLKAAAPELIATATPATKTAISSPASLLWAHQIRRENIQLVERIDNLQSTLTASSETALAAKHSVTNLEIQVKTLAAENHALREEVKGLTERLDQFASRAGTTIRDSQADEIGRLGAKSRENDEEEISEPRTDLLASVITRLDLLEDLAARLDHGAATVEDLKEEIIQRGIQLLEKEVFRICKMTLFSDCEGKSDGHGKDQVISSQLNRANEPCQLPEAHDQERLEYISSSLTDSSTVLVPNSVPSSHHDSIGTSTAPQTTSAHSIINNNNRGDNSKKIKKTKPEVLVTSARDLPEARKTTLQGQIFASLKQSNRTLAEYFHLTEQIRSRLPRRKQEGTIVEAFWQGLRDDDDHHHSMKESLQRTLDHLGWTWSVLEGFCCRKSSLGDDRSGAPMLQRNVKAAEEVVNVEDARFVRKQERNVQKRECKEMIGAAGESKNKKRKRRHISLVPMSDDEI